MISRLLLFLLACLCFACSFDNKFLQPTQIPRENPEVALRSADQTTVIRMAPDTFQPSFYRNGTEAFEPNISIESVIFESTSGNKLNGWMMTPKGETPDITLLHFHGNVGNVVIQAQGMIPLVMSGFRVFVFDYSGFGVSEGKATRNDVLFDGESALAYVRSRPDVSSGAVVIYGQSLGGNLAAVVASRHEQEVDGLVLEGAFASHKDMAAESAGFFGRMLVSEKYSSAKSIASYHKPLLVIHSSEDNVVPFAQGEKIFAAANEPKEFFAIEKCHICGPPNYTAEISSKIRNMMRTQAMKN